MFWYFAHRAWLWRSERLAGCCSRPFLFEIWTWKDSTSGCILHLCLRAIMVCWMFCSWRSWVRKLFLIRSFFSFKWNSLPNWNIISGFVFFLWDVSSVNIRLLISGSSCKFHSRGWWRTRRFFLGNYIYLKRPKWILICCFKGHSIPFWHSIIRFSTYQPITLQSSIMSFICASIGIFSRYMLFHHSSRANMFSSYSEMANTLSSFMIKISHNSQIRIVQYAYYRRTSWTATHFLFWKFY